MSKSTDALVEVVKEQVDDTCNVSQVVQFLVDSGAISNVSARATVVKYDFLRRYANSTDSAKSIMLDMALEYGADEATIWRWCKA